jgi:transcriptional regulator with XRE-family HTH domain
VGNRSQQPFSEVLRTVRTRRGVTQRQLADLSTVSVRAIRDLELGRTERPREDTVRLIADALGLSGRTRTEFRAAAIVSGTVSARELRLIYDAEPPAPPAPLGALLGREVEVAAVREMLSSGSQRLITVTGLIGIGKTRLALEVANDLHRTDGYPVLWCAAGDEQGPADHTRPLAELARTGLTGPVAGALAAGEFGTVIRNANTLLVLDGFGAGQIRMDRVIGLLQDCRGLRVLATSRCPLDVYGERTFPLAPLALPAAGRTAAEVATVPSVRLLVSRVRQVRPDYEVTAADAAAVAELCRRLDGIPAALEAAASWFLMYEPQTLLESLRADQFDFAVEKLIDLADDVCRTLTGMTRPERAAVAALRADPGWSMAEAVGLTGLSPVACARMVRRLLILGLVRAVDETDRARFQILELVAALVDTLDSGAPLTAAAV